MKPGITLARGRRGHRPDGADLDEQLAGRQGRQPPSLRGVPHHAGAPSAARGGGGQRGGRALDHHGHDRHRAARRLRERRDPAARAGRGTAAGAGGARVARRGTRPHRPRPVAREPAAGAGQRRAGRGARLRRPARPRGDGPRQPAAPQRDLAGPAEPRVRARDLGRLRAAVRAAAGVQARRSPRLERASRRRTHGNRQPGASSGPQRPGGRRR